MSGYMQYEMLLFLQSAALGAVLLLCYDVLRIMRRLFVHSGALVAAEDVLYWILTGFVVFAGIYRTNQGVLRTFLFLGIAIGMWLYHMLFSRFFVELWCRVLGIPVDFVKRIRNVLLFWTKRCRIYLCSRMQKHKQKAQKSEFKRLRGSKVEKIKKENRKHQNSK